jgi:ribonuclease Y
MEADLRERQSELQRQERRINQKDENLDRRAETLERRERSLSDKEREVEATRARTEDLQSQRRQEIERISSLTAQEARQILMSELETELREDANRRLRQVEAELKVEADHRARDILVTSMQRLTTDVVGETTVSVVPLPSDELKGRIIGREGRNIRAFEAITGVDVIIDDTPDAVSLSCFDPIRRETARVALTKLVTDGRIHPARIEEMIDKARKEVEVSIREAGEQAAIDAECPGLHPEIIKLLGRLRYRTSYGQNQLQHAVETSRLAVLIAHETNADIEIARRGGLLHDLGKSVDFEMEGTHAMIGADLARRYGMNQSVVHCIAAHHEEEEPSTAESLLTIVADAISGSRPGARRESLEYYIKRLEALESIATSFTGVEKAFAIQAGREIRIMVKPDDVDDLGANRLAREISKKIEENLEYPGQIKVTVLRETRAIEYAK